MVSLSIEKIICPCYFFSSSMGYFDVYKLLGMSGTGELKEV
jgi:hypothetical protein